MYVQILAYAYVGFYICTIIIKVLMTIIISRPVLLNVIFTRNDFGDFLIQMPIYE